MDADEVGISFSRFVRRYVTAFRLAAHSTMNLSKKKGIPLTELSLAKGIKGEVLNPIKENLEDLADGLEAKESIFSAMPVYATERV